MAVTVKQLSSADAAAVGSLWQAALDARRRQSGLGPISGQSAALHRPGAFGVGLFGKRELLSIAVAMPALADDARSTRITPGLAHISSVATLPGHWDRGLARRSVEAVMMQASRRGFARAQLWTHVDNVGARHLYESLGFEHTGRHRLDDNGEPIMHYSRDLPPVPLLARPAARIVCLDSSDRVLLLHWRDPVDGFPLWEPPGGGLEPGESPYDAVVREWREETGLPLPEMAGDGPTAVARDVLYNGLRHVVDEDFFLGRCTAAGEPVADGATAEEQTSYLGHAWVHWSELGSLDDPADPDLIPVLRRLDPAGPWSV